MTKLTRITAWMKEWEAETVSDLLLDERGYDVYTAGGYVETRAEGFRYQVLDTAAAGWDVQTAGLVKLAVLPSDSGYILEAWAPAGDGVVNDTTKIKSFFDQCIATGVGGFIGAGDYLIDLGVLDFDNGHVATPWPHIDTDGHFAVKFIASADADAPFIKISNGTAVSGAGEYWEGGSLGGISFVGVGKAQPAQDALVLTGLSQTKFGYMRADDIGGSVIKIPENLFGGTNPDPYNVGGCTFDGVEGNRVGGRAVSNENWVGMAGCYFRRVRAIETTGGAFYGTGAANQVDTISAGSCSGWGVGNPTTVTGGASTRFRLGVAEMDDVQYGIDTTIISNSDFGLVRFVHRYNFGPLNPAGGYWPLIALDIGGTGRIATSLYFNVIDRIEAGGTKGDIGVFADFNGIGSNLTDTIIKRQVLDNAGFGFTSADLYENINSAACVSYYNSGEQVFDNLTAGRNAVHARGSGNILNGGWTGAGNTVPYPTLLVGATSVYDAGTSTFTARGQGRYQITARFCLVLGVGERVRMSIMYNDTVRTSTFRYATTVNREKYEVSAMMDLMPGDTIKINADQNSGVDVAMGAFSNPIDNALEINLVT